MRFFTDAHYRFIENRKKAYLASGIALVIGVLAMIWNVVTMGSWLNYGVDFTGGTLVQVEFAQPADAGAIREALGGADAPPVAGLGSENEFVIRAPLREGQDVT